MADLTPDPIDVIARHSFSVLPYMTGDPMSSGRILVVVCDCGWIDMTDNDDYGMGWQAATMYRDHVAAAGLRVVPVVDDATRQEVPEVLVTFAKWADWYLDDGCRRDHHGYCQSHGLDKDCPVGPMREWLAAYLGRTD